jgi:hypothetical protein
MSSSCDYAKYYVNLCPYPRLHFMTPFLSPLRCTDQEVMEKENDPDDPFEREDDVSVLKHLRYHNLPMLAGCEMRTRDEEKKEINQGATLLASAAAIRLRSSSQIGLLEQEYGQYIKSWDSGELLSSCMFSRKPRIDPNTKAEYEHGNAAFLFNSVSI